MDVTLTIGGRDFSARLSRYRVQKLVEQGRMVKTLDWAEHAVQKTRDCVIFSLIPFSDAIAAADYNALSNMVISCTYTDTFSNAAVTRDMRVASDLDAAFGLRSIDGNRYYKGGEIVLRAVEVNT